MGNVFHIAKKEFVDLLDSELVLIILVGYLLLILLNIYDTNHYVTTYTSYINNDNAVYALFNPFLHSLAFYGSAVGIVIGCSSISSEMSGNALNVLTVKPLYRDTIINGKLLGSFGFLGLILGLTTMLYYSGIMLTCGGLVEMYFLDCLVRLPLAFFIAFLVSGAFMALSMVVGILIKEQTFSLMVGFILIYLSYLVASTNFNNNLAMTLGIDPGTVNNVLFESSPVTIIFSIGNDLFNTSLTVNGVLDAITPYILKLLIILIVAVVLSYIAFIRRDIA